MIDVDILSYNKLNLTPYYFYPWSQRVMPENIQKVKKLKNITL